MGAAARKGPADVARSTLAVVRGADGACTGAGRTGRVPFLRRRRQWVRGCSHLRKLRWPHPLGSGGRHGVDPDRPRVLGDRGRRRRLLLGDAALLRLDGEHPPECPGGGHRRHARRQGVLARRPRRRCLRLRGRRLLRLDGWHPAQPAGGRHGGNARRAGLLAGGGRRGNLRFGDASYYGSMGGTPLNQAVVGIGGDARRAGLLAGGGQQGGVSSSATQRSSVRPPTQTSGPGSPASPPHHRVGVLAGRRHRRRTALRDSQVPWADTQCAALLPDLRHRGGPQGEGLLAPCSPTTSPAAQRPVDRRRDSHRPDRRLTDRAGSRRRPRRLLQPVRSV